MVSKEEQVIEGISNRQPLRAPQGGGDLPAARDAPAKATPPGPPPSGAPAGRVQAASRAPAGAQPVDAAKVSALREAIASGSYKPDAAAIAERIIAFDVGSKSR
jgi:flagellar biosynthesis anti-sigma factor FlgM